QDEIVVVGGTKVNTGGVTSGPEVSAGHLSTASMMPLWLASAGRLVMFPTKCNASESPSPSEAVPSRENVPCVRSTTPNIGVELLARMLTGAERGPDTGCV